MSNGPIVVGRGRYKIYQKNNLAYVQDTQLATRYTYYYNNQSWDRNAYPDFKGTSLEELERAGVKDAQGMFSSAQSLENSRLQSRQQQQQPQPQQPQPQWQQKQQNTQTRQTDPRVWSRQDLQNANSGRYNEINPMAAYSAWKTGKITHDEYLRVCEKTGTQPKY